MTLCEISKARLATCIAMVSKCEGVYALERIIHGYNIYKATWTPSAGEILAV